MSSKAYLDLTVEGVELTAFYTIETEDDPYGTGDSPTSYEVDIFHVEARDSTINILDLLAEHILEEIENQIIQDEGV